MNKHHKRNRRGVSGNPRRRSEQLDHHIDYDVRILDPNMTTEELDAIRPTCGECGATGRFLETAEDIRQSFGPVVPTLPPLARYWGCDECGAYGIAGFM